MDNPFVDLESSSKQQPSSAAFIDPLDEIGKFNKSRSAKAEVSLGGGAFDDLDPLGTMGKSARAFSPGKDNRKKDGSPSRSVTPPSATAREPVGNFSYQHSDNTEKTIPVDNFQEPPLFDGPNVSTDFQRPFDQASPPPQYYETASNADMSSEAGQEHEISDIWLSVSEVPLFTQPTTAPPPSRPPPPIPHQGSRPRSKKRSDGFSPHSNYTQHSQSPKPSRTAAKNPSVSQFDELEEFTMGGAQNSFDDSPNLHFRADPDAFSAAAASAAAMKDAMDKAEAKFRHAKEVREREHAKAARNKESGQVDREELDSKEREFRETQERLDRERKQREEEEKEKERKRLERDRQRDIEREKGRQAVERATREARERAAAEARERAQLKLA